ncbi:response regulator transcription factor [bacterium]|nr:response regulator transcription factor [bacterium]
MKILIVEDDPDIAELLAVSFKREGWESLVAGEGEEALRLLESAAPSFCVLDLLLPGMGGLAVLRALRKSPQGRSMPVIIASALGEDEDVVKGLELGADDYLAKPFSPQVLIARIRALLRRLGRAGGEIAADASGGAPGGADGRADAALEVSGVRLDPRRHEVSERGRPVELSATEFAVLELLMREPGRVFTRSQAIAGARGEDYPVTDRVLDVHILSLRRKLGDSGNLIETVRGVGYRFREER